MSNSKPVKKPQGPCPKKKKYESPNLKNEEDVPKHKVVRSLLGNDEESAKYQLV